ncbi:hypothetical protein JOF48_000807 [Arthrobacter stackebrandtii]|uniref:Uncharacterized protein n=1 Tax=Arthrobacter stackebrandtii TaxID=272161 RepID=A0ABS4YT84_9MICC|nr:hypothetical protein [Arthrobacter stackebrandtii]
MTALDATASKQLVHRAKTLAPKPSWVLKRIEFAMAVYDTGSWDARSHLSARP